MNVKLDAECHGSASQFYWRHKSLWTSPVQVFRVDQVHYNDVGNLHLYSSFRGAIFKALSRYHQAVDGRSGSTENIRQRAFSVVEQSAGESRARLVAGGSC